MTETFYAAIFGYDEVKYALIYLTAYNFWRKYSISLYFELIISSWSIGFTQLKESKHLVKE